MNFLLTVYLFLLLSVQSLTLHIGKWVTEAAATDDSSLWIIKKLKSDANQWENVTKFAGHWKTPANEITIDCYKFQDGWGSLTVSKYEAKPNIYDTHKYFHFPVQYTLPKEPSTTQIFETFTFKDTWLGPKETIGEAQQRGECFLKQHKKPPLQELQDKTKAFLSFISRKVLYKV